MHAYSNHSRNKTLFDLPVELIEEIYLLALSATFPQTCKSILNTIKSLSPFAHAYYILGRHPITTITIPRSYHWLEAKPPRLDVSKTLSSALRYPITTLPVLEALYTLILRSSKNSKLLFKSVPNIELPRRLFRSLGGSDASRDDDGSSSGYLDSDHPLPMLRFLWQDPHDDDRPRDFPQPTARSHGGYPLVRAVHARFIPLVKFLLDHGVDPSWRDCLAVRVAIDKHDLALVKMLIEIEDPGKRTFSPNRIPVYAKGFLLDVAVKCNARDIVKYLMEEQKCVPQVRTLRSRRIMGPS